MQGHRRKTVLAVSAISAGVLLVCGLAYVPLYDTAFFAAFAHVANFVITPVGQISDSLELDEARGVAIFQQDSRTYVIVTGYRDDGIQIIDITDPDRPSPVGKLTNKNSLELDGPIDVAIFQHSGVNHAVVAARQDDGVQVISLADPTNPEPTDRARDGSDGTSELDGADGVAIYERDGRTYAVIAGEVDWGVQILNVTDPGNVRGVGHFDDDGSNTRLGGAADVDIYMRDGRHYAVVVAQDDNGVQTLNITDPTNPAPLDSLGENGDRHLNTPTGVSVFTISGYHYAAIASEDDNGVQIVNVTDPTDINATSRLSNSNSLELRGATGIDTFVRSGSTYAVVASVDDDGVQVIDVSDPSNISAVGRVTNGPDRELNGAYGIEVYMIGTKHYAVVGAKDDDGVQIIDLSTPASPAPKGKIDKTLRLDFPVGIDHFVVSGRDYIMVATLDDNAVQILDVTNPARPHPTASLSDGGGSGRALKGALNVETFTLPGSSSTYVGVTAYYEGVQIIDVSDPYNPNPTDSIHDNANLLLNGTGTMDTFVVSGTTYAAVTGSLDNGVQIIDVSDPDNISAVGQIADTANLHLEGADIINTFTLDNRPYAVVITSNGDHQLLNLTDPTNPTAYEGDPAEGAPFQGDATYSVFTIDDRRYGVAPVGGNFDAIGIFDLTDKSRPLRVGTFTDTEATLLNGTGGTHTYERSGSTYLAVASFREDGLQILKLEPPKLEYPTVRAGPDQSVDGGALVTLNGTGNDPAGHTLTYEWTHNSTLSITLADDTALSTTFTAPDVEGVVVVEFTLTGTNPHRYSDSDTMTVTITGNMPPVVDAGPDKSRTEGDALILEGSATDPDGDTPLTYLWTHNSTLSITLNNDTNPLAGFITPILPTLADTPILFTLTVTDSRGAVGSDTVLVTVLYNRPPNVDAGPDQTVPEGSLVTLSGNATDPEGHTPLTYAWNYNSTLNSPPIHIDDDLAMDATFTAPQVTANTTYTFTLTATDSRGAAASDDLTITVYDVPNRPPNVDAGPDLVVPEGQFVNITATAEDPEGNTPLTYRWSQHLFTPGAPALDMAGSDTPTLTFTAPLVTANSTYSLHFSATDSLGEEATDLVRLLVYNVPSQPPVVDVGDDRTVYEGNGVTLNGTATDPEGEGMTYMWSCEAFERGPDTPIDMGDSSRLSVGFDAPYITPHNTPFTAGDAVAFTCTFTATDIYGESASDTMTLIVRDVPDIRETPDGPVLTLLGPDNQRVPSGSSYVDPGATCVTLHDGVSLPVTVTGSVDTSARDTYQTIQYSCEHNGRQASDTRTVLVSRINERPTISVTSVRSAIGAGDTTDYGLDAVCTDREDGTLIATSSISFHNDGRTATITYTCTDSHGSTARTTLEVAVTSSAPPGIYLNGPSIQYVSAGDTWKDPGAYCMDAEDGRISARVTSSNVDTSKPGHYKVGYSCTDTDGNSDGTFRNVLVQSSHQNLPPSLSVSSRTVTVPVNGTLSLPSATCMDKEDGDLSHLIWVYGVNDVDTTRAGTYDVFYFCTDSKDEQTQAYLRVVVVEP